MNDGAFDPLAIESPFEVVARGFPTHLRSAVRRAVSSIDAHEHAVLAGDAVTVLAEEIRLPRRVYVSTRSVPSRQARESDEDLIVRCILSRHHDGFVRAAQVDALAKSPQQWTAPYILALVGEYVFEIHQAIAESLLGNVVENGQAARNCADVILSSSAWWITLQRRVISYWNAYYRGDHLLERSDGSRRIPDSYPAALVVRRLATAAGTALLSPLR